MPEEEYQHRLNLMISFIQPTNTYMCKICSKMEQRLGNLKTHVEGKHLKLSRYPCKYCPTRFNTKIARYMHIKQTHKEQDVMEKSGFGAAYGSGYK